MKVRQMDRDHIRWTKSVVSERSVEMLIEGHAMARQPVGKWTRATVGYGKDGRSAVYAQARLQETHPANADNQR
jgi:hypothetical protein